MRMRALLAVTLAAPLALAAGAQALSVGPLVNTTGGATLFSDNSAEFLINVDGSVGSQVGVDPAGNPIFAPSVTVGDILITILGINTIENPVKTAIGGGTVYNEITALTAVKIFAAGDVDLGPVGADDSFGTQNVDLWQYQATPLTNAVADTKYFDWSTGNIDLNADGTAEFTFAPQAGFVNDGVNFSILYEDASRDYNRDGSFQAGITSATNGTARLFIGLDATKGDFLSVVAPKDVAQFLTIPALGQVDNSNISLDATVLTPFMWPGLIFAEQVTGGNGGVARPATTAEAQIFDNLDLTFNATAVPEPGTMVLLGSGLLGLAGLGRKRSREA